MSAAGYTPGPWELFHHEASGLFLIDSGPIQMMVKRSSDAGAEQMEANARLIAAAPDLLRALVQALESSGFNVNGPADWRAAESGEPPWVCNARGVISEATGGTGC